MITLSIIRTCIKRFAKDPVMTHMNIQKAVCFMLITILLTTGIQGQSLDSLLALARKENPSLKMLENLWKAATFRGDQMANYPDPTVGVGFGVYPVETRLGSQEVRMNVSQRLLWKGELDARRNVEDAMADALIHRAENKWIDLEFIIRQSYFDLVYIDNVIRLIQEKQEVLNILERIAKDAIEGGNGRLSNVLMIERRKQELAATIEELDTRKRYAQITINQAIGRNQDVEVTTETSDSTFWDDPVLYDNAFVESGHPVLRTLSKQKTVSEKNIDLTYYNAKPKVMVGMEYLLMNPRTDLDPLDNGRDVLMVMGTVTLPLRRKQYQARRDEEKIKMESIDAAMEEARNAFRAEIEMAMNQLREIDIILKKYRTLKETTESTIDLLRTEYVNDGRRFEELLRLEMELVQYDMEIEMAVKQRRVAIAKLQKYTS